MNFSKIAINKSILKEYKTKENDRVVYLNDNDEFQIQLFNPETVTIACSISINGVKLSNRLVLRPGERIWLERYFDSHNKFKFSTYNVENSDEVKKAICNNGSIVINFYKEYEPNKLVIPKTYDPIKTDKWTICDGIDYIENNINKSYNNTVSNCYYNHVIDNIPLTTSSTSITTTASYSTDPVATAVNTVNNMIETGRIEKGSYSSQEFYNCDKTFENFPFNTEKIKILPKSQKPYTSNDINKIYCTNCGKRLNAKFKYCPKCGTKVEL